jgi:hypothetical protein
MLDLMAATGNLIAQECACWLSDSIPSFCCTSSNEIPLVSGTQSFTQRSWRTIMKQKKPKT